MLSIILWLCATIILAVFEAITAQLICIWFAIGGIGAFIAALSGYGFYVQIAVFSIISALCLIITRPLTKKFLTNKTIATNSDSLIGKEFLVYQTIDNEKNLGQVKVNDIVWTARNIDGNIINEGEKIVVEEISGVKLMVKKV